MKCLIRNFAGPAREVEMAQALQPSTWHEGGQVEAAKALAEANAAAIGRLLALLVEHKFCDLSTAAHVAGVYGLEPL